MTVIASCQVSSNFGQRMQKVENVYANLMAGRPSFSYQPPTNASPKLGRGSVCFLSIFVKPFFQPLQKTSRKTSQRITDQGSHLCIPIGQKEKTQTRQRTLTSCL